MIMKNLLDVEKFGAIDADNDDLLFDCFEDHEAFKDLLNFKKFIIVGRKGSGKTAIFKKILMTKENDLFTFGHTFSDYPWHYHDKQAKLGIPEYDKYTHSWKYLIMLTLSKIILNQDYSLPFNDETYDDLIKIEQFVLDTYGTRDPDVTQIFSPTRKLKLKPYFSLDWKILKLGISPESVPMQELPTIIQEVNYNLINYIVQCLNPENRYFICFDQLDLGFDPNNPEYSNRLIGLLLACRDINIKAKENDKKLFIVIFLRNDIYGRLHFEDKNKITDNYLSMIEWDTPRTTTTLKGLMEKRFTKLLKENESEKIKWADIFDETKEMPGHQTKYRNIIDHTYLRPRDIIKWCNEILTQYKIRINNENEPTINYKFDNIDINKARTEYSNYFLEELDDELHKHIPMYKEYLEIFKSLGKWQFNREELNNIFEEKKTSSLSETNLINILREFFEFSLIGFYRAGGKGYGGSGYVFKYIDPRAQLDETAQLYRLHRGLIDVLGLKR